MPDDPIELTPELLDDFYAECEEQISNARTQLTLLEGAADERPAALESLYRSVHSFKGNAAIVGLAAAEQLAHAAEDSIRRLTRGEAAVGARSLDLLGRVVQRLEALVNAFRQKHPLPAIADLLALLTATRGPDATPGAEPAAASPNKVRPNAASAAGRWRVSFRPSRELDARGVNINTVRTRVAHVATIESASPSVEPGGKIRFDFMVTSADSPDIAAWQADGVTWSASEVESATTVDVDDGASHATLTGSSNIVRVNLGRLDDLVRIVGDMVILRSRLQDRLAQATGDVAPLQEVNLGLTRTLRDLRAGLMRVRLVRVLEMFSRMPFVVRDLTRDTDKQVRLVVDGQDTEIDKHLVERLKEPLLHLVRNSVSHGIEPSSERTRTGKPPEATLRLQAEAAGDAVLIRVRDDGRGLDTGRIVERARAIGISVPDTVDERALLRIVCTPGFSTRDEADRASGRGVGMAVVDTTVRELGGTLSVTTAPGRFTEFTIRLPLTLAIADTFVVAVGEHRCALPQSTVREIVRMQADDLRALNDAEVGPYRGSVLPILRLHRWFALPPPPARDFPVFVVETDHGPAGVLVDSVLGHREIVVRPLRDPLLHVPGVSGATELGDGHPVLILDPLTLGEALARSRRMVRATPPHVAPQLAS